MSLLNGILKSIWTDFYNNCVRDVSPAVKGVVILVMFVLALLCIYYAVKGSSKDAFIKNWFLFWCAIVLAVLGIVYSVI